MPIMQQIRAYHAALAVLVIAAYLTGEAGAVHLWIGYAVAAIIVLRLVWAAGGVKQVGLGRSYPQFSAPAPDNILLHPAISRVLLLGIAITLIGTTLTGIAIERGVSMGAAQAEESRREGKRERAESPYAELHEGLANALMLLVAGHVAYLIAAKRPMARFMTFLEKPPG